MQGESTHCKLYKKVAFSHTGEKLAIFTRLRCKQWSCPDCAKKNAWIWKEYLKEKLPNVSDNWWIVTLTAHPNTTTEQGSIDNLRRNIERLIKRAKRVFGKLDYCRTFERHPTSRRIHAHFIIAGLSPFVVFSINRKHKRIATASQIRTSRVGTWSVRTWFKKVAQECKIGQICDVQHIANDLNLAIRYICKYLTKSQQDLNTKGLRHVQTTRNIGSPHSEGDKIWQTASYITARHFEPNTQIKDLNTGRTIDNDYWEKHSFYPYDD